MASEAEGGEAGDGAGAPQGRKEELSVGAGWAGDQDFTETFKGAGLVEGCELVWGVGPESALRGSLKKSDCEGCGDVEPWVWGVKSRQIERCECGHLKLVEELRSPRKGPIRGMNKHLRGRWAVVATARTLVYEKKIFLLTIC